MMIVTMYFSLLRDYLQFWNIQYCHHHYHHPPLRNFLGHLQERWYITIKLIPLQRLINIISCFCSPDNTQCFFQYFGTGAGALRIGKISDKPRNVLDAYELRRRFFKEIMHFYYMSIYGHTLSQEPLSQGSWNL